MNQEIKENMVAKQRYAKIVKRNNKIMKVDMFIFAFGLLLKLIDYKDIGEQFIWIGIIILLYTFGSNIIAKVELRKSE